MTVEQLLRSVVRDVADFPRKGVIFKDITPVLLDPKVSNLVLDFLEDKYKKMPLDAIAGVESRGFLFGFALANRLNLPFILIRKKGKLPAQVISHDYELEYGSSTIEMHVDSVQANQRILLHDDLLATGGSAYAATQLIEQCGGEIASINFLVELKFLKGREKLTKYASTIDSVLSYE